MLPETDLLEARPRSLDPTRRVGQGTVALKYPELLLRAVRIQIRNRHRIRLHITTNIGLWKNRSNLPFATKVLKQEKVYFSDMHWLV